MISDEAVEAALKESGGPVMAVMNERAMVRRILEAAAPHMLADAWREGHESGRNYQGDGWNSDSHDPASNNPYRSQA